MIVFLFVLPIENPFRLIGIYTTVQNFPLFGIISSVLLVYLFAKTKLGFMGKFFSLILVFSNAMTVLTWIMTGNVNLWALFRGNTSMLLGLMTYAILGYLFSNYSIQKIDKYMVGSYVLVLIAGFFQFLSGEYRVYATFTEPKHLGLFLVFVYLFWYEVRKVQYNVLRRIMMIASFLFLLTSTFSTTAFLAFAIYLLLSIFSEPDFKERLTKIALVTVFCLLLILLLNSQNYFSRMISYTMNIGTAFENQSGTFVDSFSLFFFYVNAKSIRNLSDVLMFLLGTGMGQEQFYFDILSENYVNKIVSMKASSASFILSLAGKFQAYTGFIGLLSFLLTNILYIKNMNKKSASLNGDIVYEVVVVKRFILLVTICSFFSLGTFQNVMNWLVYAYADYHLAKKLSEAQPETAKKSESVIYFTYV